MVPYELLCSSMGSYGAVMGSVGWALLGAYGVSVGFYGAVMELCWVAMGLSGVLWGSMAELFLGALWKKQWAETS